MKRYCIIMMCAFLLAGTLLAACRHREETGIPAETESRSDGIVTEQLPGPSLPQSSAPVLPVETIPTQPDQDYFLPPGEQPAVESKEK